jgi:hypothetical protein
VSELRGDGFSVTIRGRGSIRYHKVGKTMFVDGEMLVPPPHDYVVWTSSIGLWGGAGEPVSDDEKRRIIANLDAVLRANGIKARFEP